MFLFAMLGRLVPAALFPSSPSIFLSHFSHSLSAVQQVDVYQVLPPKSNEEVQKFDNKNVKTILMNLFPALNLRGLQYPVIQPETVKPSGFIPPDAERSQKYPFYISRTKTFNLPVYSDVKKSGERFTIIRRIAGDVELLESELRKFVPKNRIEKKAGGGIRIKGDYTIAIRAWLHGLGF